MTPTPRANFSSAISDENLAPGYAASGLPPVPSNDYDAQRVKCKQNVSSSPFLNAAWYNRPGTYVPVTSHLNHKRGNVDPMTLTHPEHLVLQPEVQSALQDKRAVVALESTVITHGLAYPLNLETAVAMEQAVRDAGATPATIAVLGGRVTVGLTAQQLEYLASRRQGEVQKCSRRDLAASVARRVDGGTTVAGTMLIAHLAGIRLFATGGIGGVHRGHPFDISADLEELGRTPVTVVSSGAKSILDLPATLEVLETRGVPVVGYQTDELPAFFARYSGLPVSVRMDSAVEIAAMIDAQQHLGLQSGILVTVPVPSAEAYDAELAEAVIAQATAEAEAAGIGGAAATPWLLARIAELSGGDSVQANVALLRNNGRIAAEIALALSSLTSRG